MTSIVRSFRTHLVRIALAGSLSQAACVTDDVVFKWGEVAIDSAFRADDHLHFLYHTRAMAMVHLAMHDAVNGVKPKYDTYALTTRDNKAHPEAAIATAAHDVLVAVYPICYWFPQPFCTATDQKPILDAELASSLASIPDGDAKDRGIALGHAAAAAILAARADDGYTAPAIEPYTDGTEPGEWRVYAPFFLAQAPGWADLAPFAYDTTSFRTPPPPVTSAEYTAAYNELKSYGRATGSSRTADQTDLAWWWWEWSDVSWHHIARVVWEARGNGDLWKAARLMALVHTAQMDAVTTDHNAKYHFHFWRPITAIPLGDDDGNPDTVGEIGWQPLCPTPPSPDYASAHAALGGSAAAVLTRFFGRDDVSFSLASDTSIPPGQVRSFTRFSQAAAENADSRVACGIHWRFSVNRGNQLGYTVGNFIFDHLLLPGD